MRQQGKGFDEVIEPLLGHRATHRNDLDGIAGIAAIAPRPTFRRRREALEVETVIDELHSAGIIRRRKAPERIKAGTRAGNAPLAVGDLLALLPIGRRPDILGMGGEAEGPSRQRRGIAGHRARRVEVVDVDVPDGRIEFARQHKGLAEPTPAIGCEIAPEIAQGTGRASCQARVCQAHSSRRPTPATEPGIDILADRPAGP